MTNHQPLLTPAERRRHEHAQRKIRNMQTTLAQLAAGDTLATLIFRGRHTADDGYTTSTGGRSNDISRPTETTAIRHAGGRDETADTWQTAQDTVGQAIGELFGLLSEADVALEAVDKKRQWVLSISEKAEGRTSSLAGQCARCERDVSGAVGDKLVSGYCGACRKAWERADYPDRAQFERTHREKAS